MIIKCKMCGGDIQFNMGDTVGQCEYCGSSCTIPKVDEEQKINRYNRANHFRRQAEFDKALSAYEKILEEDDTDSEAHWGAVLSRYGIEYVEDPATKKRIPTCHRVQLSSILADEDYRAALEYAPDSESRKLYEEEAARIAEIQRGILAISQNEKPYDVFICYKETDENGQRTHDSQWAQEIYYGLTEQGFNVFFSRITLEDKLGREYEPYIFAALNSAKVMLVIGSKPEYFNAVWVKNEWSRYLALMAKDRKRLLIPCYRGMDPYDLPDELSALQSQDMSKIGFMQDILRGVRKVLAAEKKPEAPKTQPQPAAVVSPVQGSASALLRRAFLALEDGEFDRADDFCEQALNLDPENAEAYLGKLMAELKVRKPEQLTEQTASFENDANYKNILRFGSADEKARAQEYARKRRLRMLLGELSKADSVEACSKIRQQLQAVGKVSGLEAALEECDRKIEGINLRHYEYAVDQQKRGSLTAALEAFRKLGNYGDSAARMQQCAESLRAEKYETAQQNKRNGRWDEAIRGFESLMGYRDSAEQAKTCREAKEAERKALEERLRQEKLLEERKAKEEAAKRRRNGIIALLIAALGVAAFFVATKIVIPAQQKEAKYKQASALTSAGQYAEAYAIYTTLRGYKDVDSIVIRNEKIAAAAAAREEKLKPYKTIGSVVTFGTYPQTGEENDETPIEWLVLDAQGSQSLLISRYALDCKQYHKEEMDMTWEQCTLRTWLNGEFINKAFTAEEQAAILTTAVDNSKAQGYSGWDTNGGNNTQDKVFLLSYAEAWKYFAADDTRKCAPTDYAVKQGVYTSRSKKVDGKPTCWWWLRSPGDLQDHVADVINDGSHFYSLVNNSNFAIRPAFWVNLESDIF